MANLQVIDAGGNTKDLATGSGDGTSGTPFKSPVAEAFGAQADSSASSDTGTFSFIAFVKRLLSKLTSGILMHRGAGSATIAKGQISVTTPATQIVAARSGRSSVTIINHGTTDIYIGFDNTVSIANGFLLPGIKGAALTLDYSGVVYGIVSTGSQTVSYMEEY